MPLIEDVANVVSATNLKVMGEIPGFYAGMGMANAISHQQAMNSLNMSLMGAIGKTLTQLDPSQSMSELKLLSGNDAASTIAQLTAALASSQVGGKIAGNMPPVTP